MAINRSRQVSFKDKNKLYVQTAQISCLCMILYHSELPGFIVLPGTKIP